MWSEIVENSNVCSGALIFQFSDGWYKCSNLPIYQQDLCPSDGGDRFPGSDINEEYFGMLAFVNTQITTDGNDTLRAKEVFCRFKHAWKDQPRAISNYVPTNFSKCPAYPDAVFEIPEADAFVRGGDYADQNYGLNSTLEVKYASDASFTRESWFICDLSSYINQPPFLSADLVLFVQSIDLDDDFTFNVDDVTDVNWSENTITWNNKPTVTTNIGQFTRAQGDTQIQVDILSQVNAKLSNSISKISLRVYKASGTGERLILYSKDSASEAYYPRIEFSSVYSTTGGVGSEASSEKSSAVRQFLVKYLLLTSIFVLFVI